MFFVNFFIFEINQYDLKFLSIFEQVSSRSLNNDSVVFSLSFVSLIISLYNL